MKLGVIVPYRDRESHLKTFNSEVSTYLKNQNIDFEIIIVEQSDNKPFNRGKLLNIGYLKAKELLCDYVVFHDVDMIPLEVDYSYSNVPLHLATDFEIDLQKLKNLQFDDYFGGVTMFSNELFEKTNGYSNNYWGWGFEDDDLLYRCKLKNIPLDSKIIGKKDIKNIYGLYFKGDDSYVKIPKKDLLNFDESFSVLVSFKPDNLVSNPNAEYDEYTIFSIPGYDTCISYNSFRRYKLDVWDIDNNCTSINSEILTNHFTQICFTYNSSKKEISLYKDGNLIKSEKIKKELKDYSTEEFIYLAAGNPNRENANFFKGLIADFAIYNTILEPKELKILSENVLENSLLQDFRAYKSADNLVLYYDSKIFKNNKLIDLTLNGNDGDITNSYFVKSNESLGKEMDVPFRKKGKFKLLTHKSNSWNGRSWVHRETRINQLKFLNEIGKGLYDINKDGLNTCQFQKIGEVSVGHNHHISVLL